MFGSPTSFGGVPFPEVFVGGFGSPATFDGSEFYYPGFGFGDPAIGFASRDLPTPPPFQFAVVSVDAEFGDDGGALVELYATGGTFPVRGPYLVRLVDADGKAWPPESRPGCYSAIAGGGDRCEANRSREFLRFALPKLPQGAYGVRLEWGGGINRVTLDDLLLVVPADLSLDSAWLRRAFG